MDVSDFNTNVRRSSRTSRKKILKDFVSSDNRLSLSKQLVKLNAEPDQPEQPVKTLRAATSTKRSVASEDSDNENRQTNNQLKTRRSIRQPNYDAEVKAEVQREPAVVNQNQKVFEKNEEQMFVDAELFDTLKPRIRTYQRRGPPVKRRVSYSNIRTYGSPKSPVIRDIIYQVTDKDAVAPDPVKDPLAPDLSSFSCLKEEPSSSSSVEVTIERPKETLPSITFVDIAQITVNCDKKSSPDADVLSSIKKEIKIEGETDKAVEGAVEIEVDVPLIQPEILKKRALTAAAVAHGPYSIPKYYPGQLLWGRVSPKSVYWPCLVVLDKDRSYCKLTGPLVNGKSYFIRFFADNGRSSWVTSTNLQLYEGLDKFKSMAHVLKVQNHQISNLLNRKDPEVPTLWEKSISEADMMIPMSMDMRVTEFFSWFPTLDPDYVLETVSMGTEAMEESQPGSLEPQKKEKKNLFKIRYVTPKNKKKSFSKSPTSTNAKTKPKAIKSQSHKKTPNSNAKASKKENKKNGMGASSNNNKKKKAGEDADLDCPPKKKLKLMCESLKFDFTQDKVTYEVFSEAASAHFKDDDLSAAQLEAAVNKMWCDAQDGKQQKEIEKPLIQNEASLLKFHHLGTNCRNEKICFTCHQTSSEQRGKTKQCKGGCWQYYHVSCGDLTVTNGVEACKACIDTDHLCFICKHAKVPDEPQPVPMEENEAGENANDAQRNITDNYYANLKRTQNCEAALGIEKGGLVQCSVKKCGHYYHVSCVRKFPQTVIQGSDLTCPMHTCHTCVCDNPQVTRLSVPKEKLVSCVKCPTTYHTGDYCMPSGAQLLSMSQVICPKHDVNTAHTDTRRKSTNCNWCFLCTKGGVLLCCDGCPATVHTSCLRENNIPIIDPYYCEDCLSGRFPLYEEVVWVKHASFRWWPAQVIFPDEAPEGVLIQPHKGGEYIVRFFGSKDYTWTNNHRTFTFNGDDKDEKFTQKGKQMEKQFSIGVMEAREAHAVYVAQRTARDAILVPTMKPPNYVKIKVNKILTTMKMQTEPVEACDCIPNEEYPCRENCINKDLYAECNPSKCPAGLKCENQKFTKREYPQLDVFHTKSCGWGLKTLEDLEADQFVIEYVGEVIDEPEFQVRVKEKVVTQDVNYYFLAMNQFYIDAGPRGNIARFMNHSCNPNCKAQKWNVKGETRIGLFTNQAIKANTELTFDYNLELLGTSKQNCCCASKNCGGYIGVKPKPLKLEPEKVDSAKTPKTKKKNKEPANKSDAGNEKQASKKTTPKVTKPISKSVKKDKVVKKKYHDDICFQCEESGALLVCEVEGCTRAYHEACIPPDVKPSSNSIKGHLFQCPWHFCKSCHKIAEFQCFRCDIGYCKDHTCLLPTSKLGLSCPSHE